MKQVEVSILGQVYMLGCPEGGEALLVTAVASVDKEMTAIREGGKVKARERIAVLAALNLAYQLAERSTASASALPSPPKTSPNGNPDGSPDGSLNDSPTLSPPGSAAEIDALVRRIDAALGEDGQLL